MGCVPTKDANSSNQKSLLMLGLDGAGSTTILYRLILNKSIETIPTLGFNQESLSFEGMEYDIWDIGGLDKVRPLWRQYSREADGFIFVVDANDRHRAADAADELRKFFGDGGKRSFVAPQTPLLVFANKQAMSEEDVSLVLDLAGLPVQTYCVVACCAKTGENLRDGLIWMTRELERTVRR